MEEDSFEEDSFYNNRYVTLFDNEGFESIIDITCDDTERMTAALEDKKDPELEIYSLIHTMKLRATFNPHRNPEIWIFWSHIDEETLWKISQENPQTLADLIREKGVNVTKSSKSSKNVIV